MIYFNIEIYPQTSVTSQLARVKLVFPLGRRHVIPLGYALLGLLAREPLSGYDLTRAMENPIGFFWHARRSQIYPELARLEAAGFITHRVVEQEDRPDKKVYSISASGRAALLQWVTEPARLPPDRDEFMLKVYSLWLASPSEAIAMLQGYERAHTERLATYEAIREQMESQWPEEQRRIDSPKFAAYATLMRGIEYERGYVAWCRWLISALEQQPTDGPERRHT